MLLLHNSLPHLEPLPLDHFHMQVIPQPDKPLTQRSSNSHQDTSPRLHSNLSSDLWILVFILAPISNQPSLPQRFLSPHPPMMILKTA